MNILWKSEIVDLVCRMLCLLVVSHGNSTCKANTASILLEKQVQQYRVDAYNQ